MYDTCIAMMAFEVPSHSQIEIHCGTARATCHTVWQCLSWRRRGGLAQSRLARSRQSAGSSQELL